MTAQLQAILACWNRAAALAGFKGTGAVAAQIDATCEVLEGAEHYAVLTLLNRAHRLCSNDGAAEAAAEYIKLAAAIAEQRGRAAGALKAAQAVEDALWPVDLDGHGHRERGVDAVSVAVRVARLREAAKAMVDNGFGPQETVLETESRLSVPRVVATDVQFVERDSRVRDATPDETSAHLAQLCESAPRAASAHREMAEAFIEERLAGAELLRAAVESAREALPAVCTRTTLGDRVGDYLFRVGGRRAGSLDERLYLDPSGGFLAATFAPQTDRCVDVKSVSPPEVAANYDAVAVVKSLVLACDRAAEGNATLRSAQARDRAARLRAAAKTLGGGR